MTGVGYVTISTQTPHLSVTALLDDDVPQSTGGAAVWEEDPRPQRTSVVKFTGVTIRKQSLPIILDGWADSVSVQADSDKIEQMAALQDGASLPPVITVTGIPGRAAGQWVMESDIEWGDELRDPASGELQQRCGVLSLIEYVPGIVVLAAPKPGSVPFTATHTVVKGDTLQTIAVTYYGTASRWKDIGTFQHPPLRDPRAKLKPGLKIVVPL